MSEPNGQQQQQQPPPQQQQQQQPPPQQQHKDYGPEIETLRNDMRAMGSTIAALPESVARAIKEAMPQQPSPPQQQQQQQNSQQQQQTPPDNGSGGSNSNQQGPDSHKPGKREPKHTLWGMDLGF